MLFIIEQGRYNIFFLTFQVCLPSQLEAHKRLWDVSGAFTNELDVLEWLRKNRYRQPELNLFMYALIAITLAFVMYTVFLVYGFQQPPKVA